MDVSLIQAGFGGDSISGFGGYPLFNNALECGKEDLPLLSMKVVVKFFRFDFCCLVILSGYFIWLFNLDTPFLPSLQGKFIRGGKWDNFCKHFGYFPFFYRSVQVYEIFMSLNVQELLLFYIHGMSNGPEKRNTQYTFSDFFGRREIHIGDGYDKGLSGKGFHLLPAKAFMLKPSLILNLHLPLFFPLLYPSLIFQDT